MRSPIVVSALTLALVGAGCGAEEPAPAGDTGREPPAAAAPSAMPSDAITPEIQAVLEEGNEAYRARDFETALERYEAALAMDSTVNASWFGVYMAHEALGNDEEAAAVRERLGVGGTVPHPGMGGGSPHPGASGSPHPGAGGGEGGAP